TAQPAGNCTPFTRFRRSQPVLIFCAVLHRARNGHKRPRQTMSPAGLGLSPDGGGPFFFSVPSPGGRENAQRATYVRSGRATFFSVGREAGFFGRWRGGDGASSPSA